MSVRLRDQMMSPKSQRKLIQGAGDQKFFVQDYASLNIEQCIVPGEGQRSIEYARDELTLLESHP